MKTRTTRPLSTFAIAASLSLVLTTLFTAVEAKANQLAQSAQTCELALILAIDASSSVDELEYDLQKKGLAAAISSPQVMEAILANNGVEVMAFEWSGRYNQVIMEDWTRLDNELKIGAFAVRLAGHTRATDKMPTAVGYALGFASGQFNRLPRPCTRHVIDVAGDGIHNEGFSPFYAYKNFDFAGVTVNAMVIKGEQPDPEMFYRREVLHGPGAFLIIAKGFEDYEAAMKEKLLKEMSMRSLSMAE